MEADGGVVVNGEDGQVIRHGQLGQATGGQEIARPHVAGHERGGGLGQFLQEAAERGDVFLERDAFGRPVDGAFGSGRAHAGREDPLAHAGPVAGMAQPDIGVGGRLPGQKGVRRRVRDGGVVADEPSAGLQMVGRAVVEEVGIDDDERNGDAVGDDPVEWRQREVANRAVKLGRVEGRKVGRVVRARHDRVEKPVAVFGREAADAVRHFPMRGH